MSREPSARRSGAFAARLALSVLVGACLLAIPETLVSARLAGGAVTRETVARVQAAVEAASVVTSPSSTDPGSTAVDTAAEGDPSLGASPSLADVVAGLGGLARERDVTGLWIVAADGTLLAQLRSAGSVQLTAGLSADAIDLVRQGTARSTSGAAAGRGRTVAVPLELAAGPAAVVVTLDAAGPSGRTRDLWRALALVLGLGAVALIPLVFVLGGRGLAHRHAQALTAAATDDLTGLGSRRAFRLDLADEVTRARRRDRPLTLALLDLNGLELVNSTVGRRRGDALLAALGAALHDNRWDRRRSWHGVADRAYRVGGDAFAVLMPGTSLEDAFSLTDRLRRQIALDAAPLTANVGLSSLDDDRCPDAETLLIAADAALFEARALGGNRVVGSAEQTTGLRWLATSGRDPDGG